MAEEYKNIGNEHFKNKRYKEAIESYTMASSLDVSNPTYPGEFISSGHYDLGKYLFCTIENILNI